MSCCRLCKSPGASSDQLCDLCRSVHRLVRELIGVPTSLRAWALDSCRQWSGIVQEEVAKGEAGRPKPPGTTAKAGALVVQFEPAPAAGSVEPPPVVDKARGRALEKTAVKEEQESSPERERARSSGIRRRRPESSPLRRRRDSRERDRSERKRDRRGGPSREVREDRGIERKTRERSPSYRERERTPARPSSRPAEPREPPPGRWRDPRPPKGRGKGKRSFHPGVKKWKNKGVKKVERQERRREGEDY